MNAQTKHQSQPVAPVSAVCAAFRTQSSVYPPETQKPDVAPTCGSVAGTPRAEKGRLRANFGRGRSHKRRGRRKAWRFSAPARPHLPAVRAVSGIYEGVVERAKIAPVGSQFEKSPPFQGKRRGCTKKVHGKRKKQQVQRWVKQLRVYGERQLAGLKTCKLPSKKSALYCTRDSARISRTIIYRNNIDTDPPYWVLLVLRRVEGRFR